MATCKYCQGEITWKQVGGGWKPHEVDGTPHPYPCKVQPATPAPDLPAPVPMPEQVKRMIDDFSLRLDKYGVRLTEAEQARRIEIALPDREPVPVGRQHSMFPTFMSMVQAGVNVLLVGPAGAGKTQAASAAAEALLLNLYVQPIGPQTTKSDILGFTDANGVYRASPVRHAFGGGGVLLMDEFDAGNAASMTISNGLRGESMGFPDGLVKRHPDFRYVAAANTYGLGADRIYVGRSQMDAASLDGFVILEWNYDWGFTKDLCGNEEWCDRVAAISNAVRELTMRVVVGPRSAIFGATLLKAGMKQDMVEQLTVWSKMTKDDKAKVEAHLKGK